MDTATFSLLAPFLPDAFQPAHFIKTFRECRFTVKASAEIAENIKVVTRFKLRRHHLFHGDNAAVRVVAELIEVVTLKLGGSRQNDIRKAAGRRPLVINSDDRFQLAPAFNYAVNLLVSVERVGPGEHAHLQRR
ncbi:Uncharacterised protein [Salmonella enterica subsp. enterica serovar Typhi]|nr:Uncharacterised protein [Salmonella enterica subsp. enterica serovar Typhi]CRB76105.1 Uncharacterised protein [Salmonella enterica subsp. enterica serovar Typhi]